MSECMNCQKSSEKQARINTEKDSLIDRQQKLINLTKLLDEERLETKRYKELAKEFQVQLEREKLKCLRRTSDEDRYTKKDMIEGASQSSCVKKIMIPAISHNLLENLVHELAVCKRQLKKLLDGCDMKTFLDASEYEDIVKELQETIRAKECENEKLRLELKERYNGDREIQAHIEMQIATLTKQLDVKTVLVNALTNELEKLEMKCYALQRRCHMEIET
ncbi:reticulocyte-binding protein homolog 2a-like [Ptychodera flava]|uniref:reticulocyte-binding protein homolog 2a-like n=1 Tax=Ptychodera flava TaxID=63121 RepID=UPI003969FB89